MHSCVSSGPDEVKIPKVNGHNGGRSKPYLKAEEARRIEVRTSLPQAKDPAPHRARIQTR